MFILEWFRTPGPIFGPAMFLAGIVALILCVRATRRGSPEAARLAMHCSILPLCIGICGSLFGLGLLLASGKPVGEQEWKLLGQCTMAGMVVTAVPLLWSYALRFRAQPQ
jgi:hypothetical protein